MLRPNGVARIEHLSLEETPRLLVLFDPGQEGIARSVAEVLGQTFVVVESVEESAWPSDCCVVGIQAELVNSNPDAIKTISRSIVNTHAIDIQDYRNGFLSSLCDYEYLYSSQEFTLRDLTRFLQMVLDDSDHYQSLRLGPKTRSSLLSLGVPDVRTALTNIDIVTIGADAIELRVDLLRDPNSGSDVSQREHLNYVGEQVSLLRQNTHLPIVFCLRSDRADGQFHSHDPMLFYEYWRKAIQWGCEYIDVELWLPQEIRAQISIWKRHTRIISTFHDFSGHFCWSSDAAWDIFLQGATCSDIVNMVVLAETGEDDYHLESFRSVVASHHSEQIFCGRNVSSMDALSYTVNSHFTPITHGMFPAVAPRELMTAAEVNERLQATGRISSLELYAIGANASKAGDALILEKCANELGLPFHIRSCELKDSHMFESFAAAQPSFGGAYFTRSMDVSVLKSSAYCGPVEQIGFFDVIVSDSSNSGSIGGDNLEFRAIVAALTQNAVPCAFRNKSAVVIGDQSSPQIHNAAILALTTLGSGSIYSVGFKATGAIAENVQYIGSMDELKEMDNPFVVISALPYQQAASAMQLLKMFGAGSSAPLGKLFLQLQDPLSLAETTKTFAEQLGWRVVDSEVVRACKMVLTVERLLGQNVGFDFWKRMI